MTKRTWLDLGERMAATAAEAGLAYGVTYLTNTNPAWAIPLATVLAFVKGKLAKYVGDDDTAALLPAAPPPQI